MQYESIILELITRVKKLEDEVEQLRQKINELPMQEAPRYEEAPEISGRHISNTVYTKTTDEMIDACYLGGKKLHGGEDVQKLADRIVEKTGMNRNSSIMYMQVVDAMLSGTVYKRAINTRATRRYFDCIYSEYGAAGLRRAVKAARLHIDYRRSYGMQCDYYSAICDEYERKL